MRGISTNRLKKVSDKIKKGLPVSLYDEETGQQTVFMTEEGYKEMNDWWNGPTYLSIPQMVSVNLAMKNACASFVKLGAVNRVRVSIVL